MTARNIRKKIREIMRMIRYAFVVPLSIFIFVCSFLFLSDVDFPLSSEFTPVIILVPKITKHIPEEHISQNQILYYDHNYSKRNNYIYPCLRRRHFQHDKRYEQIHPEKKFICSTWIGLMKLKNIFFSLNFGIYKDKIHYYYPNLYQRDYYYGKFNKKHEIPIYSHVSSIIVPCTTYFDHFYAHLVRDYISILLLIPNLILNKSYIMFCNYSSIQITDELFTIVGIDKSRLFNSSSKEFVYTDSAYLVYGFFRAHYGFIALIYFKNLIFKRYNIDNHPSKYLIQMRSKGYRFITNHKKVTKYIIDKFKSNKWDVIYDSNCSDFISLVKLYAKTKFLFCATGSSALNIVFMSEGTGCVYYKCNLFDTPVYIQSFLSRIYTSAFQIKGYHYSTSLTFISDDFVNLFMCFKSTFYAMDRGMWPSSSKCFHVMTSYCIYGKVKAKELIKNVTVLNGFQHMKFSI